MQVGGHGAGEPLDPEGAAAVGIRKRDDLALSGSGIDGGDDAADQDDDEEEQGPDDDAEPFRDAGQDAHQKACPMPI